MILRIALLCTLTALVAGAPARAQVQVNQGALDRLEAGAAPAATPDGSTSKPSRHKTKPASKTTAKATPSKGKSAKGVASKDRASKDVASKDPSSKDSSSKDPSSKDRASKPSAKPEPVKTTAAKPPPAPPTTIAPAPPAVASLAPDAVGPTPRPLPAPVIPLVADAAGEASPIPGGLRITFGANKADLSPATAGALHDLGRSLAANPNADVNVYAYAAGAPDDPSTPRRLSLSRALAARAVLMSENIASTRIYVRALGSTPSVGPADRVDVQQANLPPAGQLPPAAPAAPPAPPPAGPGKDALR